MANDIFEGNWKQIRGKAREWWGNLTDDELDQLEGKREQLAGLLQKKYGYAKEKAEQEIDQRLRELKL